MTRTEELRKFLAKASAAGYAGGVRGEQREEFTRHEFEEGNWRYVDSYTGFFQSWGQETVWHNGKPLWVHLYGGGTGAEFRDKNFVHRAFEFLKKVLSAGGKEFRPRGPDSFKDGDWEYHCSWTGSISCFRGSEEILFKGEKVFTHEFFGGLVIGE